MTTDTLAVRATARELVAVFQEAAATVRTCFGALHAAEARLAAAFSMADGYARIRIPATRCHHSAEFDRAEESIAEMARDAWRAIVDRLDLRRLLSVARYEQLQTELEKGALPELTEDAVVAFVRRYVDQIEEMHDEAVAEVFEFLRPRSLGMKRLKTNSELEVPAKVILRLVARGPMGYWRLRYWKVAQNLIALENVLHALDGRGMVASSSRSALQTAIEETTTGTGETDLFSFRCCENGNLHLRFKRLDLLARLNAKAGGKRLRPPTAPCA